MTTADLSKSTIFLFDNGKLGLPVARVGAAGQNILQAGAVIDGKYRVIGLLGTGGMGAVYRVQHLLLGNEVALKTFQQMELSEEELLRFEREAKALANLTHKHLVKVFDYGLHDGVPYYTMEYLEGESLSECLTREGRLSLPLVAQIFVEVVQALKYIHAKNIVHRDLKPGNIFLQRQTQQSGSTYVIKLVDFGIASITASEESQKLTGIGRVFGSPLYMSPEQGLGLSVSNASDSYSLGCSIFESLIGSPPFQGANALATILLHQTEVPPRLSTAGSIKYPERLEVLVSRLLIKDPLSRLTDLNLIEKELLSVAATTVSAASDASEDQTNAEQDSKPQVHDFAEPIPVRNKYHVGALLIALTFAIGVSFLFKTPVPVSPHMPEPPQSAPAASVYDPSALKQHPSYEHLFTFTTEAHKRVVIANFPSTATDKYSLDDSTYLSAAGQKKWLRDQSVCFNLNSDVIADPKNLDQFAALNVVQLLMNEAPAIAKNSKLLKHISTLTKIQTLDISNGVYGDSDILCFQNMPKLHDVVLAHSRVTGAGLAKLSTLKNLRVIDFSENKNPTPLLRALQASSGLQRLRLNRTDLQSADFTLISTLKNLEFLSLNDTNVTDAQFATLVSLKHLQKLTVSGSLITDASMPIVLQMKQNGLENLQLGGPGLSLACCERLQRLFPGGQFGRAANLYKINPNTKVHLDGNEELLDGLPK